VVREAVASTLHKVNDSEAKYTYKAEIFIFGGS